VKKPTEESTRERDLGVSVGRDSRYGSIYVCPPLPPGPRALVLPPSSSFPPSVPRIPHPQFVPLGVGVGRMVRWVHRAQVSCLGGPLGYVLEAGWWWAGVNP
jgi:hypothetical protein